MKTISLAVFLALISDSDAISLDKAGDEKKPEVDAYNYEQFGKAMPEYWHDMNTDPFFSNTWRFSGANGHVVQLTNDTAYTGDAPADYHFPTEVTQWEPDSLLQLREGVRNVIEEYGMTAVPYEMEMI